MQFDLRQDSQMNAIPDDAAEQRGPVTPIDRPRHQPQALTTHLLSRNGADPPHDWRGSIPRLHAPAALRGDATSSPWCPCRPRLRRQLRGPVCRAFAFDRQDRDPGRLRRVHPAQHMALDIDAASGGMMDSSKVA